MSSDTLVSARVSKAKKDAAQSILKSIGATTSDLINCALDYVIAEERLPSTGRESERSIEDFFKFEEESTLNVDWQGELEDGDYRSFIREGRMSDYESLA